MNFHPSISSHVSLRADGPSRYMGTDIEMSPLNKVNNL